MSRGEAIFQRSRLKIPDNIQHLFLKHEYEDMIILRILAALVIFYLLYRIARWLFLPPSKPAEPIPSGQRPAITEDLVEDPCCHAYLPVSQAYQASIDGKTQYFCSEKCYRSYVQKKTNP